MTSNDSGTVTATQARWLRLPVFDVRATYLLIGINVLVFFVDLLSGYAITSYGALVPLLVVDYGQWWRLIVAGFLHASLIHIGANLYALYGLGRLMEHFFGFWRFLVVYGLSLLGCSVFVTLLSGLRVPTVGASGAIMGILGALVVFFWRYRDLFVGGKRYVIQLARMALLNLGIGLLPGISLWGHLGGFLAGAAMGIVLSPRYRHLGWPSAQLKIENLDVRSGLWALVLVLVEFGLLALAFWWRG